MKDVIFGEFDRLKRADKRLLACDGNLIALEQLFVLVIHSTNLLR